MGGCMDCVPAGSGAEGAARRDFYGVKYSPVQQRQTHSGAKIPFLQSDNSCVYILWPGCLSASLPIVAGCITVFIFPAPPWGKQCCHPPGTAEKLRGMGWGCYGTLPWSHTKLAVEWKWPQGTDLYLCFNTQMGDEGKNRLQVHKKGKGRSCVSTMSPDAFLPGEVSSDSAKPVTLWMNCRQGQKCIFRWRSHAFAGAITLFGTWVGFRVFSGDCLFLRDIAGMEMQFLPSRDWRRPLPCPEALVTKIMSS